MTPGLQLSPARQRGVVALLFAVLIVALCTIFAVSLAWDSTLDARRSASLYWREQSVQVALGAEDWIGEILKTDQADTETDHFGEIWALELPPLPVDGAGLVGDVSGRIEDLQGRFNVNTLVDSSGQTDPAALERFVRLLQALDIDPKFAGLAADWIDTDQTPAFPDGAEDPVYTGKTPPYRAANQLLTHASELALLEGMEPEILERLRPHIVALPEATFVNVNTATPPVLMSLDDRIDATVAEQLVEERAEGGFADYQATFGPLVAPDMLPSLGETSSYFRLRSVVRIGTVRITMYSLLHRGAQGEVTTILRSFGTE